MKKVLLSVLVMGLVASASNAATLWMEWDGTDPMAITANPGDSLTVEYWVTLNPADDLINFFAGNETFPATQTGVTTAIAGWIDASVGGDLGALGQQVAVGTPGAVDPIAGGTYQIASQTIRIHDDAAEGDYDLVFNHASAGLLDGSGASYTFGPMLAGSVPHFYTYGAGSPGVTSTGLGESPRNPLVLTVIPEPATFALLALGGLAIIRRR